MVIVTERLVLRPFKLDDVQEFYNITQDSAIKKYVPDVCQTSVADLEKEFRTTYTTCDFKHDFYFVIQLKDTEKIIGCLIVTQNIDFMFDTTLVIAHDYRRKGYMTEALNAFIGQLPKNQIFLFYVDKSNLPSLKTVNKIGALEVSSNIKNYKKFLLTTR
jgi:RimJ/RimL family protein N-acetyltransferase